jgi:hypothetical protein
MCLSSQARYGLVLLHCQCNNNKPVLWFSPVIIPLGLHTHTSWGGWTMGPLVAAVQRHILTPLTWTTAAWYYYLWSCLLEAVPSVCIRVWYYSYVICSHLSPVFVMDYDVICEVTLYVIFISTHKSDSISVAETKGIILDFLITRRTDLRRVSTSLW